MSTRKPKKDVIDRSIAALSNAQVIELATSIREMWRHEVAAGKMKLDPARMRKYDKDLTELKQLARG